MRHLALSILLLCGLGCEEGAPPLVDRTDFGDTTWSWQNPWPDGSELLAVAGGTDAVFAVGRNGAVLRGTAAGWEDLAAPFAETLLDVLRLGPDHVLVCGDAGRIAEWDGGTWRRHESGTVRALAGLARDADGRWVAVGAAGTRLRFGPGGWAPLAEDDHTADLEAIHVTDAGVHYAVASTGAILRSDDASTWVQEEPPSPGSLLLDVTGWGEDVYACGIVSGVAVVLQRGPASWSVVHTAGATPPLVALAGSGPAEILALAQDGRISYFDGLDWTDDPGVGAARHRFWDAFVAGDGTHHVVGSHGGVFRRDPGAPWSRATPAVAAGTLLWAAARDGEGSLWFVGEEAVLRRPRDGLLEQDPGPAGNWFGVAAPGPDLVTVGAGGRAAVRSGGVWSDVDPPLGPDYDLRAVWAFGPGEWLAVGTAGTILRHDATGWHFEREPAVQSPDWNAIWARDRDFVVVAGDEGAIALRTGGQWHDQAPPTIADLNDLWGTGPADLVVVGALGAILAFDGQEWRHQALFVTGEEDYLTAVDGRARDDLFVVGNRTLPGLPTEAVVFRFDGRTWRRGRTASGVGLSDLVVDGDGNVWAVGSGGTLWRNGP